MQKTKKEKDKFIEDIVLSVTNDFNERRIKRKLLERQWEINMNFYNGNQYFGINGLGDIEEKGQEFFWQNREVFNHIAPLMETRLVKFSRISPRMCVRPYSDDDKDIVSAEKTEKLIEEVFKKQNVGEVIKQGTMWSEICGTSFYKVVWNNLSGENLGKVDEEEVFEGGVEIIPVSPFEIFPDSLYNQNVEDCQSIIHARAMTTYDIKKKYNVVVAGEEIGAFNLSHYSQPAFKTSVKGTISDACIVIEKYEKPSKEFPEGRLITVAGGKLLFYGSLPYVNGGKSLRTFPFVKQESLCSVGSFFGTSIIERLIPVQRAYNAVKNRKHEFLNRLSMGVLRVEDGSIDVDDLTSEGLCPGKVLVYRQGSKAPEIMENSTMPNEFCDEEEKLLSEFVAISGISDITLAENQATVKGATALELLIEQDNEKLLGSAEKIRSSYVEISKHIIRLYRQFITSVKLIKEGNSLSKIKITYIDKEALHSDDVYCENDNEMLYSDSQKKQMMYTLYSSGLLAESDGTVSEKTKGKVLSILGYKDLDVKKGTYTLQEEKAQRENKALRKELLLVEEIDDDDIHITEHTRYVLGEYNQLSNEAKERFYTHIKEHKNRKEENLREKQYERAI